MDPERSGPRGQRASARKSGQSGGGRARGKRPQQRPRGGSGQSSQQRFNPSSSDSLNSIRSEATAGPEAPLLPSGAPDGSAPRAARVTPAVQEPPQPRVSQSRAARASKPTKPTKPSRDGSDDENASPLKEAWLVEPGLYDRLHNWLADAMPFTWRERARRPGYWRRRAVPAAVALGVVIVAVIVGNFGLAIAQQAAHAFASVAGISSQDATPGSVIISPLNNTNGTPTPGPTLYAVGVWTSNTMPTGGSVKVYVRVSRAGEPVAKARVSIQALTGRGVVRLGPLTTNSYGMASAQLYYGGGSGRGSPIYLTATTKIGTQTYSGTYTFYALG